MPLKKVTLKSAPKNTPKAKKIEKVVESSKKKVKSWFADERVVTEDSDEARELYAGGAFGTIDKGKVALSLLEALYLMEKNKITILDGRNREMPFDSYLRRARRVEPLFWIRYCVFRDLRNRGYIAKTALKFGADFRVYDRGIKPGDDHARWVVFPVHEGEQMTWHEFAAKNRVAHSTKKRLLIAIVDDEADVTYYEVKWMRP